LGRRFAEGCTAVAVATARGMVGLHLLAGAAAPAWQEAAPQCLAEGLEMAAVRSQVPVGLAVVA
jgi:nuclear pore complex protein Nup88